MTSSAPSLKELSKAVNNFIPVASLPLPDDLTELIETYVREHENNDDSTGEKLHEELVSIYEKSVLGHSPRYAPFMNILRRLNSLIRHPKRTLQWWELLKPGQEFLTKEKGLAEEGQAIVLAVLTADWGSDAENIAIPLAEKALLQWLTDCEVAGRAEDGLENVREQQIRETLILYGKKRPRDFMTLVERFMVKKQWRARTLHLMSDFIRNRPPHLYQINQTPLFNTLINCLQLDTSTTIVSLALTVLIMVLPHMPSSLVPHLPVLFNIYARLLFWERELSSNELGIETVADRRVSPSATSWEKVAYSSDFDDTSIPHLLNYFTILYGLYPWNFMDYIRKPQRYLRHAEVPNADDIEVQPTEIRHASEQFRQCHMLHENFYTLTIDSEKTDFGRWIKSEPAEVVADCMALRQPLESSAGSIASHFGVQELPALSITENTDRDGSDAALLSSSIGASPFSALRNESWRNLHTLVRSPSSSRIQSSVFRQSSPSSRGAQRDSSSTRPSGRATDSPTLRSTGSFTHLQDMINSNKAIKSGLHQSLANDSVPSLALSHHESIAERPVLTALPSSHSVNGPSNGAENRDAQIRHLYRQILLLHNDLTFERFMKQQHLTHMGELRRRHVREAASEAEMQDLLMQTRNLKKRLEEAKKTEIQVKKDSEKSRSLAKKWEADLSAKLRTIREEQKKWLVEKNSLMEDLEKVKAEADALRKIVCDAEVREIGWKQKEEYMDASENEMDRLRVEVDRLTEIERTMQTQEFERQAAINQATEAVSRAEILQMKLDSRDVEFQQTHHLYQSQIVVLNAKLQDVLKNGAERRADALKTQLDAAMATSRTQQTELKKRINELTKKNTALNATLLEIQSKMPMRSMSEPQRPSSSDLEASVPPSEDENPLSFRNRQHRGFSEPETFDATSYNPTPPLEPFDAVLGSYSRRPSTPAGTEGSSSTSGKVSPSLERYHGRGGIQNVVRKEKRDKKDEKEKKKSSGLRGLRGF